MKNFLLLFTLLTVPFLSFGANLYVTNTNDAGAGSLREQIANSFPGDTVFIDVSGTLLIQSQIQLNTDITIIGPGPIHFTIDGTDLVTPLTTGFVVNGNQSIFIEGITFTNFTRDPVATGSAFTGTFEVSKCLFEFNNSTINIDGGNMVFEGCSFYNNINSVVVFSEANSIFTNCTFANNYDGALFSNNGTCNITNCTFYENGQAIPQGKALLVADGIVTLRNNIFFNDTQSDELIEIIGAGTISSLGGNITNDQTGNGDLPQGTDVQNISVNAGISFSVMVTDGWGLKYFPPSAGSDGIDIDTNPNGLPLYDQRRVWRVMDGGSFSESADAGAVEYSQLTVRNAGTSTESFDDLYQFVYNSAGVGKKAFVFEISGTGPFICPVGMMPWNLFEDSTIVNGFSQNGSRIPGPGLSSTSVTNGITPIVINNSQGNLLAIEVSGFNSVVAGLSIIDFGLGGTAIKCTGEAEISGNHIGVAENGLNSTPNMYGVDVSGTAQIGSGNYCGDLYHSNRNVISGNTNAQIAVSTGSGMSIAHNFIGLASDGISAPIGIPSSMDTGIVLRPMTGNDPIFIGGYDTTDFNVIGGQDYGISIACQFSYVLNNIIGGTFTGESISGDTYNSFGISITGIDGKDNWIGDTGGTGNTIIGNGTGIRINNEATYNGVYYNHIGVSKSGTLALGNLYEGVLISDVGTNFNDIGYANMSNVISNNENGIKINFGASNNYVNGNLIGFSGDGNNDPMGNANNGILVEDVSTYYNEIGRSGAGNIIGNNGANGIHLSYDSQYTKIQGNIIGFSSDTVNAAGNAFDGIFVDFFAAYNSIGGCNAGDGNYIGYNGNNGIAFENLGADYDTVYGNKIGVTVDGGNAGNTLSGIAIIQDANNINIGNTSAGCANEIAFNGENGIVLSSFSYGNYISGNSIHDNVGLGIDIDQDGTPDYTTDDGLTGNDATPIGTVSECVVCGGNTSFTITPESTDLVTYEVFKADGDGQEGDSLVFVWTGNVFYLQDTIITMPFVLPVNMDLVMTASINQSTSEFGPVFTVAGPPVALTPSITSNSICVGSPTPTLSTTGEVGTPVWFADAGLSIYIATGNNYTLPPSFASVPSSYTFYVVDSVAGCYGTLSSPVSLSVIDAPLRPISGSTSVCEGVISEIYSVTPVTGATYAWNFATELPGEYSYNNNITYTGSSGNQLTADFFSANNSGVNDTLVVSVDSAGCISNDSIFIGVLDAPFIEPPGFTDPTTCGGTDGQIIFPSGLGTFDFYYNSGTVANVTANGSGDSFLNGFPQGTYSFDSVSNAAGCYSYLSEVLTLNDPPPPTISGVTEVQPTTCGGTGSLIVYLTPGSASGPYTVDIDGGTTIVNSVMNNGDSLVITGLLDGQIITNPQVTVDATLCLDSFVYSASIADPLPPTVNAGPDNFICEGNFAFLTGSTVGGDFYSWDNGGGNTLSTTVSPSVSTTYTLTVTDTITNCTATDQAIVTVNPLPVISFTTPNEVCEGNAHTYDATVTGNGPFNFNWQNGIDFVNNSLEDATTTVLPAGTYTHKLIVTDINSCVDSSNVILNVNLLPNEGNPFVTDATCFGNFDGSIMIAPPGTYSHSWAGPNSFTASTQDISGLEAGGYTNTMTDLATGCVGTYSTTVNQPTQIILTTSGTDASCNGLADGTATASISGGTGAINVVWYSDAGLTSSIGTSNPITGLAAGTYYVEATDGNGCTAQNSVIINEPIALLVSTAVTSNYNGSDISCSGFSDGQITATPSGGTPGYTFQWYIGASPIAGETSAVLNNQSANSYTVEVTDLSGCVINDVITLTEPTSISLLPGSDQTVCEGSSVNFNASATGGTGTITYSWSPAGALDDPNINNPLATPVVGTTVYSVTATDLNGCSQIDSLTTTVNPTPLISGSHTDPLCFGGTDGSITLVASGGQAPYQYSVNAGVAYTTSGIFNGLSNGSSICRIQDANGCESVDTTIVIANPTELLFTTNLKNDTCSKSVGEITINATGGSPTYSYSINNGVGYSGSNVFGGLTAGNYDLLVQDANGCISSTTNVSLNDLAGVVIADAGSATQVSCFGFTDANLNITTTSDPFGVISYAWTSAGAVVGSTSGLSGMGPGIYTVVATDNATCADSLTFTVAEPTQITALFGSTHETCAGISDGSLFVQNITGGTGSFSTDWQTNPGGTSIGVSDSLINVAPGSYTGITTDANGCTTSGLVDVNPGEAYTPSIELLSQTGSCLGNNSFDFGDNNNVPSSGAVSFNWGFPSGSPASSTAQNPTGVTFTAAGVHEVTYAVVSNNGCMYNDTLDITIGSVPNVNAGLDQNVCSGESANLTGLPSGGIYTYEWTLGNNLGTGNVIGNNANVTVTPDPINGNYYVLTVTEAATGCFGSDSLSINVTPTPSPSIDQAGPIDICENLTGSYSTLSATSNDTPAGTFSWFVASTSATPVGGNQLVLDNSNVGNHYIYLQESNSSGCASTFDSIQLTFTSNDLELLADPTFCQGDEVAIEATGSGAITWVNSQGEINDTLASSTTAIPVNDGTVYLAEMDLNGCLFIDSLVLNLDPNCLNEEITVNAFSPDGDGVNDNFLLDIPSLLQYDNNVQIFNRWGDEIGSFQNYNNADVSWDGRNSSGEYVTTGTYFYIIEIPELNIKESGWIQVVR